MQELSHDVGLLVSIAKVDAGLSQCRRDLALIPAEIAQLDKKLSRVESAQAAATARLEATKKERRELDAALDDHQAQITKYKNQLMQVKTNKEYTAMLKEIENLEAEIDRKEERVLELMDEVDEQEEKTNTQLKSLSDERAGFEAKKSDLEKKVRDLNAETERLGSEKPKLIAGLDPKIKKRYERLLKQYGDLGVANVDNGFCGGCNTQLPPQIVVEAKKNNQLLDCQSCGRLLIHYSE